MAKTKSTSATNLGRESSAKRLGVKLFEGEKARPGVVLIKQRGTKFIAGKNVKRADDDTLYAMKVGTVKFRTIRKIGFNKKQRIAKIVDVL